MYPRLTQVRQLAIALVAALSPTLAIAQSYTVTTLAGSSAPVSRSIDATGSVSTLAGKAGSFGSADGSGSSARFKGPLGIAVDEDENVYVADTDNASIRKITAAGVVSTLAGQSGSTGLVYISDHGNHVARKISPAGLVTTLAGSGSPGKTNGSGSAASFKFPSGIAVDSSGTVYLADTDNQLIRRISATGEVSNLLGNGQLGATDGPGTSASFTDPKDVSVDAAGNLYLVDRGNHTIRKATLDNSTTTPPPAVSNSSSLTASAAGFLLNVPYLEYNNAGVKQAYAVQFTSATLSNFTLVSSSLKSTPVVTSSTATASFSVTPNVFKLVLPYLEVAGSASRSAYSATLVSTDLNNFTVEPGTVSSVSLK